MNPALLKTIINTPDEDFVFSTEEVNCHQAFNHKKTGYFITKVGTQNINQEINIVLVEGHNLDNGTKYFYAVDFLYKPVKNEYICKSLEEGKSKLVRGLKDWCLKQVEV